MHAVPMNGKQPLGHDKSGSMTYRMTVTMKKKKCRFHTRKSEEQAAHFRKLLSASFRLYRSWHSSDI